MKRFGIWAVVVAVVGGIGWCFVVDPIRQSFAETGFQGEVRQYLVSVEPAVAESAFDWVNTSPDRGFVREDEHNRLRLIDRLSYLRSGGRVQFSGYESDSWRRLHRDILEEAVWCARGRAEKELGKDRNGIDFETAKRYLPSGWEKRFEVELLHSRLCSVDFVPPGKSLGERHAEFVELRGQMDKLMDELKSGKKQK